MPDAMITIKVEKLRDLLKGEQELRMLTNGGVDNWDWFGESLNPDGEESYYDFADRVDEMTAAQLMELANGS